MPIRLYKCSTCGFEKKALRPQECHGPMEILLVAPSTKFLEPRDKDRGKSIIKDQDKILKERAKDHVRANDYHDLTQTNNNAMAERIGWINEKGRVKTKLEDK